MKYLTVVIILFNSSALWAQSWAPAKIILGNGDTVRASARLLQSKLIETKTGDKPGRVDNRSAREFLVDGGRYISTYYAGFKSASGNPIADSAFAKVLITGDLNLYYVGHTGKADAPEAFILQAKNSPPVELSKKIMMVTQNGQEFTRSLDAYRTQLQEAFKDCPTLKFPSGNFYTERSMRAVVNKYMACKGLASNYVDSGKRKPIQWTLLAGWDFTNVKFSPSNAVFYYLSSKNVSSQRPFFGIQAAIPTKNNKFNVLGELILKSTSVTMQESNATETSYSKLDVTYLRLGIGGRYTLAGNDRLKLDLIGSLFVSPLISKKFQRAIKSSFGDSQDNTFFFKTTEMSYVLGLGLRWNEKYGITLRSESTVAGAFSQSYAAGAVGHYLYAGVTYRIK